MSLAEDLTRLEQLRDRGALDVTEFARAKAKLLDAPYYAADSSVAAINGFRRSRSDRWIGGLCGGLARATQVESWVWRLLFTLLVLLGGSGLLAYLLLWLFVPSE